MRKKQIYEMRKLLENVVVTESFERCWAYKYFTPRFQLTLLLLIHSKSKKDIQEEK